MKLSIFGMLLLSTVLVSAQIKSDPSGKWGGSMITDEGPGGMELILGHEEAAVWKATLKFRIGGQEILPVVDTITIDNDKISFSAASGRSIFKVAGNFAGDTLKGTIEVFQQDKKVGTASFNLTAGGELPPARPQGGGGQMADPNFDATVAHPAYSKDGPAVLFDEAHFNFHTAGGRYKPFADLIRNDGYRITSNTNKFSAAVLKSYSILVISNALGAQLMADPNAGSPAFTEAESDVVRDWVNAGGSLLLIADHAPMGAANQILARRFGVDMSKMFTVDPQNCDKESNNPSFIVYTRAAGTLVDHPITNGRNPGERVDKIIAFTGQSLKGPADSVAFMKLSDTAVDAMPGVNTNRTPAAGRAQGIAMKIGKGRVIVLGEAGMLSAQIAGPQQLKFGMNRPGIDNRQLALNIMHWLSGLLQ